MYKKDYYDVLGLKKGCQQHDIRKNYYREALRWHPDKNSHQSARTKFNEIREAYSVLSDPKSRELYDQTGHKFFHNLSQPSKSFEPSIFFKKGFCGTDKSPIEMLWDILQDDNNELERLHSLMERSNLRSDELFNRTSNLNNKNQPNIKQNHQVKNNISFLTRSQSPSSSSNKSYFENSQNKNNHITQSNNKKLDRLFQNGFQPEYIIVEDSEDKNEQQYETDFLETFSSELQDFQNYMNDFHQTVEDTLGLSTSSKRINKTPNISTTHDKPIPHMPYYIIPPCDVFR